MRCPSDPALDLLFLGQGSVETEAHVAGCVACTQRLEGRRSLARDFRARLALPTEAAVFQASRRRWRWPFLIPVAVAVGVALLIGGRPERYDGLKGGPPSLQVFRRRDGVVRTIEPGDSVTAGDQLRFVPRLGASSPFRFVLLGFMDGTGRLSFFYPEAETGHSVPVPALGEPLPGSVVLDGVPGPERLIAIFSDHPLPARALKQASIDEARSVRLELVLPKR